MDEKSVLVLGDSSYVNEALDKLLAGGDYSVERATSGPEALAKLSSRNYKAFVVDPSLMDFIHSIAVAHAARTPNPIDIAPHSLENAEHFRSLLSETSVMDQLDHGQDSHWATAVSYDTAKDATCGARNLIGDSFGSSIASQITLLDCVADSTQTCLAYLDRDFNIIWVNAAYANIIGLPKSDIIGRNHNDVSPSQDCSLLFEQARITGERMEFKASPFIDVSQSDRGVIYLSGSIMPMKDGVYEVRGFAVSLVDVTDDVRMQMEVEALRYEAERRAKETEEHHQILQAIIEYMPSGIIIADSQDYRINMASTYACELMGLPPGALQNVSLRKYPDAWKLLNSDGTAISGPSESPIIKAVESGEIIEDTEWIIERPDGVRIPIIGSACPIADQ